MISNRTIRTASLATALWLVMFVAVPAARAQRQKRTPAGAAPASKTPPVEYVCFSTDPRQRVVYLSRIFGLAGSLGLSGHGSVPDSVVRDEIAVNWATNEVVKTDFQNYLVRTYNYESDTVLVDCSYMDPVTTSAAVAANRDSAVADIRAEFGPSGTVNISNAPVAATRDRVIAEARAAKKGVVETGWKDTEENLEHPDTTPGQEGGRQVAQQGNQSAPTSKATGPLFQWHMDRKTDALSGDVSTQPAALKIIGGAHGKSQGVVSVRAYCSSNGVSIFFQADPGDKAPEPSFPWYDDTSRGDEGGQITDVRLRVDDRPVHVAQGFPEVDGHQVYTNTLGLLFYEPHTEERAVRDQENRVSPGVAALDALVGGVVQQAARSNAETWQSNSAGPLSDLVNARSIRIELPVTTFDPKPLLDLNPQDPVLHKFVKNCNAKFTR